MLTEDILAEVLPTAGADDGKGNPIDVNGHTDPFNEQLVQRFSDVQFADAFFDIVKKYSKDRLVTPGDFDIQSFVIKDSEDTEDTDEIRLRIVIFELIQFTIFVLGVFLGIPLFLWNY